MITIIIIGIILYFVFAGGEDSSSNRRPTNVTVNDLVIGDQIEFEGLPLKITEITTSSNPNLLLFQLTNLQNNNTTTLYFEKKNEYTLINGIYVRDSYSTGATITTVKKQYIQLSKNEIDHKWKSANYPGATRFMMRELGTADVKRQIENMTLSDSIYINRKNKSSDRINVFNRYNQLIGSIPDELSKSICRKMDAGIKYNAKIIGAFGKNGIEIAIWPKTPENKPSNASLNNRKDIAPERPTQQTSGKKKQIKASELKKADKIQYNNGDVFIIKDITLSGSGKTMNLLLHSLRDGTEKKKLVAYSEKYDLIESVYVHSSKKSSKKGIKNAPSPVQVTSTESKRSENTRTATNLTIDWFKPLTVRLTGVTYEGRQTIIPTLSTSDKIYLKRDYQNRYDQNAIGVHLNSGKQIGWIPRENALSLAKAMDNGLGLYAQITKILGGNGYNFGVEILVSSTPVQQKTESSVKLFITNQANKGRYTRR